MILKITNPREAIIESFNRPVLYKNYILLKGTRVVGLSKDPLEM